jgi:hypothetical protein
MTAFIERLDTPKGKRLLEEERAILDATEMICETMEKMKLSPKPNSQSDSA